MVEAWEGLRLRHSRYRPAVRNWLKAVDRRRRCLIAPQGSQSAAVASHRFPVSRRRRHGSLQSRSYLKAEERQLGRV
jgi:hypothetical protein